ncbi:MAG: hypothetical protein ACHP84_20485 [Caulobacterales bacterium]
MQPAQPLGGDSAALTRVLQQAGVAKDAAVRVTGPAGPTATIWLSRSGFERATYVHASHVAAMEPADVLLVPHSCGVQELGELLQGGSCLREGGVLIVQTALEPTGMGGERVSALLTPLRYELEHHISDRGREIYIARRLGFGGFKQAA